MRPLIIFVQVLASLVVTATIMPALLVTVPAAQSGGVGIAVAAGVFAVTLLLIVLVWPRRKSRGRDALTPRGRDSTL